MENLIPITIRSTHYYLIETPNGMLMVDTGWAGSLPVLKSHLKRYHIDLANIRFLVITHHHPDHAGLTQELKRASGAHLLILEHQVPYLQNLAAFYAGNQSFEPVKIEPGDRVLPLYNHDVLQTIGIPGQIVATPGHSDDSVSLILDSGLAFIGDLHPPGFVSDDLREQTVQSWKILLDHNARVFYPAHGESFLSSAIAGTFT